MPKNIVLLMKNMDLLLGGFDIPKEWLTGEEPKKYTSPTVKKGLYNSTERQTHYMIIYPVVLTLVSIIGSESRLLLTVIDKLLAWVLFIFKPDITVIC